MELEVSYIKKLDYGYINLKDVKGIVDFKTKKNKFVIISLKEYEGLKQENNRLKAEDILYFKGNQ